MSKRIRRPHRIAFRLTAEQMDQVDSLAKHWGTFGKTHTFERMIEHCGWELLVGPRAAAQQVELPKALQQNGTGKSTPRPTRRSKKGGKP